MDDGRKQKAGAEWTRRHSEHCRLLVAGQPTAHTDSFQHTQEKDCDSDQMFRNRRVVGSFFNKTVVIHVFMQDEEEEE